MRILVHLLVLYLCHNTGSDLFPSSFYDTGCLEKAAMIVAIMRFHQCQAASCCENTVKIQHKLRRKPSINVKTKWN